MMKWYLDTEFYERPGRIDLISIGLVSSQGDELYAENASFDWAQVERDHWLQDNVRPHLDGPAMHPEDIRSDVLRAVGRKPEFWGWYCDYDWVVFCWLFGRMVDLPKDFPTFCRDLRQLCEDRHVDRAALPPQTGTAHNALADARWNREVHRHIVRVASERNER